MKKGLLTIGAFLTLSISSINAQVDTLTEFFTGTFNLYGLDSELPADSGYVSGNNMYGDLAKMQLFDATHGVTDGGTITGVVLCVPVKVDAGGTFQVAIWDNNAGTPGTTPIAFQTVNVADVDTSSTAYMGAEVSGIYNVAVTFSTPVAIPVSGSFWAGVVLPTAGDAIALLHNTDLDFADGVTHTGEIWSDGSFYTFGDAANWDLKIALAIFPVVNFVDNGIAENATTASVYPNPANDVLNFNLNGSATSIEILSLDGKVVASQNVTGTSASVNVAALTSGIYMYQVTTTNGVVTTNKFVKK